MRDAERVKGSLHLGRRLHFLEAEFGFGKDGVAERLGFGKILADGFADALLQLFLVDGWTPFVVSSGAGSCLLRALFRVFESYARDMIHVPRYKKLLLFS